MHLTETPARAEDKLRVYLSIMYLRQVQGKSERDLEEDDIVYRRLLCSALLCTAQHWLAGWRVFNRVLGRHAR